MRVTTQDAGPTEPAGPGDLLSCFEGFMLQMFTIITVQDKIICVVTLNSAEVF